MINDMRGYVDNIEEQAKKNSYFRKVLYTAKHSQLVVMSLLPGEEIGQEVHELDQFFRIEEGRGKVIIDGVEHDVGDGSAIVVPQGASHNVINTGSTAMKLSPSSRQNGRG